MRFALLLILFAGVFAISNAQPPVQIEMGTVTNAFGNPVSDGVMVYGAESLKKNISYDDVKGSPFIDSFRVSMLYDANDRLIGKVKSKINFYTFQLHYLDKSNAEYSVDAQQVRRVEYVTENGQLQEVFVTDINALNQRRRKVVFAQQLNKGETRLIKFISRNIGTYDSLMGNFKRYIFVRSTDYYLVRKSTLEPLHKLGKEKIYAFTRHEAELEALVKKEKLDLRKEKDVVALLDYLNKSTAVN